MSNLELPDEIRSPLEQHLNRNLLKYAAGAAIYCPHCSKILDCRKTVIVTVPAKSYTYTLCCACYDECLVRMQAKGVDTTTWDVVDGRTVFAMPKRTRKGAAK
jgi:hypothetical protein